MRTTSSRGLPSPALTCGGAERDVISLVLPTSLAIPAALPVGVTLGQSSPGQLMSRPLKAAVAKKALVDRLRRGVSALASHGRTPYQGRLDGPLVRLNAAGTAPRHPKGSGRHTQPPPIWRPPS
jgi:hypothetical protein